MILYALKEVMKMIYQQIDFFGIFCAQFQKLLTKKKQKTVNKITEIFSY